MRDKNNERGEVMVEAAIYFPFVLLVVFFILLLSIMQLNQYILNFQTSRVADIASMDMQYEGFDSLSDSSNPSFAAGLSETPGSGFATAHYRAMQNSDQKVSCTKGVGKYSSLLENSIKKYSLINGFVTARPTVYVERGFTDIITVDVTYDLKMPKIIEYITGSSKPIVARSCTSKVAIRPVNTIRRYDAMKNQIENYYGGDGWMPGVERYSNWEFDYMATGGSSK
ncbi:MAG: hypothetical protein J5929_08200 [Eubacterium sp.]|nr:hypothetical protein [Eubacterium sp.]